MDGKIEEFIKHVRNISKNEEFVHHKWFVKYHLEIVDRISAELCDIYAEADRNFVRVLSWIHDYGKILDFDNQYESTLVEGRKKLNELGFDSEFVEKVVSAVEMIDRKDRTELESAPIEIRIVSSADGASHLVGPFFAVYWQENQQYSVGKLMDDGVVKATKDWQKKIVLPEVHRAFERRHKLVIEQNGVFPKSFL